MPFADPEARRTYQRGWESRNRVRRRAQQRRKQQERPDQHRARLAVSNAIRSGRLTRGTCEINNADCVGRIEAHHVDYDKPLEVQWLCRAHHIQEHARD